MYRIIKGGETVACMDRLTYIKKGENGCFILTDEENAQGIVAKNTPYNLMGKTPMDGLEEVTVVEANETADPEIGEDARLLGQEITAMELESIAQGQKQTALELAMLEQGQYITDMELEGLKHV